MDTEQMDVGDRVIKDGGDYTFEGWIIAVFTKRNGAVRYAVEDDRGVVMIMHELQLRRVVPRRGATMGATI